MLCGSLMIDFFSQGLSLKHFKKLVKVGSQMATDELYETQRQQHLSIL